MSHRTTLSKQSAKDIVAKLRARNIKVVPSQVYQALTASKKERNQRKVDTSSTNSTHTDVLDTAIVFIRRAGGMNKAKELLTKLSLIQN